MWVCVHVSISAPSLHARGATTSLLFFIAQMQITNMWNVLTSATIYSYLNLSRCSHVSMCDIMKI